MSLDRDIALLGSVEILSGLSNDELRLLAFGSEVLEFSEGRVLYREGQHADCAYVIAKGRVELARTINGSSHSLRMVGPGSILGEMALITQTQRLTTAIALEQTAALRINRTLFRRMLDEYPQRAADLHAVLSNRLAEFLKDIGRMDSRFSTGL